MAEIIPAIMSKSYEDLKNKIALVRGAVPLVQIDLCDGRFVKSVTWPFHDGDEQSLNNILNEREGLPFWEDIDFELDLMIVNAVEDFDTFVRMGPKRIVFHIEAVGDIEAFKEFLEGLDMYVRDNIAIGVAINTTTPVEDIFKIISNIDFVQCMGIEHDGAQGEEFDARVLSQIEKIRASYPDVVLSVDGSVNFDTAPELINAGVDRLIIGSAIFKTHDIVGTIREFENL